MYKQLGNGVGVCCTIVVIIQSYKNIVFESTDVST